MKKLILFLITVYSCSDLTAYYRRGRDYGYGYAGRGYGYRNRGYGWWGWGGGPYYPYYSLSLYEFSAPIFSTSFAPMFADFYVIEE